MTQCAKLKVVLVQIQSISTRNSKTNGIALQLNQSKTGRENNDILLKTHRALCFAGIAHPYLFHVAPAFGDVGVAVDVFDDDPMGQGQGGVRPQPIHQDTELEQERGSPPALVVRCFFFIKVGMYEQNDIKIENIHVCELIGKVND